MRKVVAALAVAATVGGVVPIAAAAIAPTLPPARVADRLEATLASAAPTDLVAVFVHGATRQAALDAVREVGLVQVGELQSIGVPVAIGTPGQIAELVEVDGVTYVEPNAPLDPLMETARVATRADRAIETVVGGLGPFDGAGQTIAVVDGGVDGTHPMFTDPETGASKVVRNLKLACFDHLPGVTFEAVLGIDPATCPADYTGYEDEGGSVNEPFFVDVGDSNDSDTATLGGHGTHVAGIAAGNPVTTADGRELSGVAPGAKIVALSMGLSIAIYGADAALDWVARHHTDPCGDGSCPPITVVNNSYGGGGDWDPESATSKIQARLVADGVTMVWANGNSGGDGSSNASGRDAANTTPGVISVANYDDADTGTRDGALSDSSSRGLLGDPKTWPDLSAPGTDITSACRVYLSICDGYASEDTDYGTITGTSMAAPHVAGAVAVLQQAAQAATGARLAPAAVEDLLEDTSYDFAFGGDYVPDPFNADDPSSFDKGHGLLDLEAAVRAVLGAEVTPASDCAPGAPLLTDAAGDADPEVDVQRVEVVGQPERKRFVVRLTVDEVSEGSSASFSVPLTIGDERFVVTAADGAFAVDGVETSGRFDAGRDEVRIAVPRALVGDRSGAVAVKAVDAGASYSSIEWELVGAPDDDFAGGCATVVDLGPPVTPDGVAAVGRSFRWEGDPTTAVTDPATGSSVTVAGTYEDVRRIEVRDGTRVAFEVTCANPLDDYDITLTGPDGKPVGEGTDVGRSANPGCAEKIVVANARSGTYTATVVAYATLGGTYAAELRVK